MNFVEYLFKFWKISKNDFIDIKLPTGIKNAVTRYHFLKNIIYLNS